MKELDELEFVDCGKIWEPMPVSSPEEEVERVRAGKERETRRVLQRREVEGEMDEQF